MTNVITIGLDDLRRIVREEVQKAVETHDANKALLSSEEVYALMKIKRTTLWRWRKEGKIAPVKSVGNRNLYRREDVEKLIG